MVLLTSSQSPVADLTSTMYCRTRSKALDWFQVTCNDVSMIVVMVTSEGATGTKTKIHQLLYVKQTQKLFLWPITKCADNPRNQSEPEARHVAVATGGKMRFAPIGGRYFWLADKVAQCFSANYKASFYTTKPIITFSKLPVSYSFKPSPLLLWSLQCHTINSSQLSYRTNKDFTSQKIYLLQSSPLNQVDWCNCTETNCCSKLQLVRPVLCLLWRHSQESFACREAWNSVGTRSLREKVFHPQCIATELYCLALLSVWSLLFSPSLLNKFEWIISTELYMFP